MVESSQTHTDPVFGPYEGSYPTARQDSEAPGDFRNRDSTALKQDSREPLRANVCDPWHGLDRSWSGSGWKAAIVANGAGRPSRRF
jgi:hypothetical protein